MVKWLQQIDSWIEKGTAKVLVACVFAMLLLALLSIVLRWFQKSVLGLDSLVRHLVFFSAFLGGVLATGRGTHIAIDILGKNLENKGWKVQRRIIRFITSLAATLTLLWLVKASCDFLVVEWQYGKESFFGIHSAFLVAIIPFGLSLIAFRFFFLLIRPESGLGPGSGTP